MTVQNLWKVNAILAVVSALTLTATVLYIGNVLLIFK